MRTTRTEQTKTKAEPGRAVRARQMNHELLRLCLGCTVCEYKKNQFCAVPYLPLSACNPVAFACARRIGKRDEGGIILKTQFGVTVRHDAARHGTVRHSTARHGTALHGTARHGTIPHGEVPGRNPVQPGLHVVH